MRIIRKYSRIKSALMFAFLAVLASGGLVFALNEGLTRTAAVVDDNTAGAEAPKHIRAVRRQSQIDADTEIVDAKMEFQDVVSENKASWGEEMTGLNPYSKWLTDHGNLDPNKQIIVAVLDSGIDSEHEAFIGSDGKSRIVKPVVEADEIKLVTLDDPDYAGQLASFEDFCLSVTDYQAGSYECADENDDVDGHGTAVASVIASSTPDNVKILPIRVSDGNGNNGTMDTCIAMREVYGLADIINLSLGTNLTNANTVTRRGVTMSLVEYLEDTCFKSDGTGDANNEPLIVAAAGNQAANSAVTVEDFKAGNGTCLINDVSVSPCIMYPAGSDHVATVTSVSRAAVLNTSKVVYGFSTVFSNYGSAVDFAMPGSYLRTASIYVENDDGTASTTACPLTNGTKKCYQTEHGTSFSAPMLAAAAALVKTARPDLTTGSEVRSELENLASTAKTQMLTIDESIGDENGPYQDVDSPSEDANYFGRGVVDFNEKYGFSTAPKMYAEQHELGWLYENADGNFSLASESVVPKWTNAENVELTLTAYDGFYQNARDYRFSPIHGYGFGVNPRVNTTNFGSGLQASAIKQTVTVSRNGTYYFWLNECLDEAGCLSGSGGSRESVTLLTIPITYFDRKAPVISNLAAQNVTENSVTLKVSAADAEADENDGKSGLAKIELCSKKGTETDYSCRETALDRDLEDANYLFENLAAGTNYNFRITIYDQAGNRGEIASLAVATKASSGGLDDDVTDPAGEQPGNEPAKPAEPTEPTEGEGPNPAEGGVDNSARPAVPRAPASSPRPTNGEAETIAYQNPSETKTTTSGDAENTNEPTNKTTEEPATTTGDATPLQESNAEPLGSSEPQTSPLKWIIPVAVVSGIVLCGGIAYLILKDR